MIQYLMIFDWGFTCSSSRFQYSAKLFSSSSVGHRLTYHHKSSMCCTDLIHNPLSKRVNICVSVRQSLVSEGGLIKSNLHFCLKCFSLCAKLGPGVQSIFGILKPIKLLISPCFNPACLY